MQHVLTLDPTAAERSPAPIADFAQLVATHQRAVWAVAYSVLGDAAASEEIAQEAFLVAWRKLPRLAEAPVLPAWFCGIARNLANNARRRVRPTEGIASLDDLPDLGGDPLDAVLEEETQRFLRHALDSLPPSLREPLVMHYSGNCSVREIALALEIREDTARKRLSRGKALLEKRLHRVVERGLRRLGPSAAFSASVLAGLGGTSGSAQAANVATTMPSASGTASSGVLSTELAASTRWVWWVFSALALGSISLLAIGSREATGDPAVAAPSA